MSKKSLMKLFVFLLCSAAVIFCIFLSHKHFNRPVRFHDPSVSYDGFTLYCSTYDDRGGMIDRMGKIYLINNSGDIVHHWRVPTSCQLARLLPSGNLMYSTRDRSYQGRAGLREIDPSGNVLWYYPCRIDHDFEILDNGNILIHTIADIKGTDARPAGARCPRIYEITKDKEIVWEWRGEDHIQELKDLANIKFPAQRSDWAHNNTTHVIGPNDSGQKDGRFRAGNIIFSYSSISTIGVIDKATKKIVWTWGRGILQRPHTVTMLENGNMLIYDNGSGRKFSRVIIFNPLTEKIVWEWGPRNEDKFFSPNISSAQMLPNGNILVCSGEENERTRKTQRKPTDTFFDRVFSFIIKPWDARIFEITKNKSIVWDYRNYFYEPRTFGVYRAYRYSKEHVAALLEKIKHISRQPNSSLKALPYIA